jgi:hypothetical protein
VALGSADPNEAELRNITRHGCLRRVDPDAAKAVDQIFLCCDLMLADQGKNRFLPLTL